MRTTNSFSRSTACMTDAIDVSTRAVSGCRCQSCTVERIAARGLRTSCATPASSRPSVASRSARRNSSRSRCSSRRCRLSDRARLAASTRASPIPPSARAAAMPVSRRCDSSRSGPVKRRIAHTAALDGHFSSTGCVRMMTRLGPTSIVRNSTWSRSSDSWIWLRIGGSSIGGGSLRCASSSRWYGSVGYENPTKEFDAARKKPPSTPVDSASDLLLTSRSCASRSFEPASSRSRRLVAAAIRSPASRTLSLDKRSCRGRSIAANSK